VRSVPHGFRRRKRLKATIAEIRSLHRNVAMKLVGIDGRRRRSNHMMKSIQPGAVRRLSPISPPGSASPNVTNSIRRLRFERSSSRLISRRRCRYSASDLESGQEKVLEECGTEKYRHDWNGQTTHEEGAALKKRGGLPCRFGFEAAGTRCIPQKPQRIQSRQLSRVQAKSSTSSICARDRGGRNRQIDCARRSRPPWLLEKRAGKGNGIPGRARNPAPPSLHRRLCAEKKGRHTL